MKTAHTPGPWRLILQDNVIEAPNGGRLIDIIPRSLCVPKEERDANARLIAASPELFAAMHRLVSDHEQGLSFDIAWADAKAALAKATKGNP